MSDFSTIKQNILYFLENQGVSKYKFYQQTGISNGVLSQKGGMSEENIIKILSFYTELNANWLLTGKGEMLKKDIVISNNDNRGGAIVGGNNSGSISINERKEDIALLYERLEHKDREIALLERELKSYKYTEEKLEKANAFTNTLYERKIEDLKQRIEDKDKMLEFLEKMNKLK